MPAWLVDDAAEDAARRPRRRTARDWTVDVVAFLLAAALGAYGFFDVHPDGVDGDLLAWIDVAAGVGFTVALWWRRRWPVALLVAATPFGVFASSVGGAGMVLLFSLAVHRPLRLVVPLSVLQLVLVVPYVWLFPEPGVPDWVLVLFVCITLTAVVAWGAVVRSRRQLVASLRERAERAEREQQLLVTRARDAERTRIAREMHDVLAHRISLLSMHAGALEFRPDAPADDVARAAGVIRASAHEALEDLREVIGVLRRDDASPGPERPQPTLDDLPALLDECRAAGAQVDERVALPAEVAVPRSLGRNAYRVVQEGLTNARKHAAGAPVRVTVSGVPGGGLEVEVRNAAPPPERPPAPPGAGTGIVGLRERVELAGGDLTHGPTVDGGFRLRAWMPWQP
nr:histidine kinase [Patulibacter sp. SYSU D01012]